MGMEPNPIRRMAPSTRPISRSGTISWRSDSRVTFQTPHTAPVAA
jgi:hypothetical protein